MATPTRAWYGQPIDSKLIFTCFHEHARMYSRQPNGMIKIYLFISNNLEETLAGSVT